MNGYKKLRRLRSFLSDRPICFQINGPTIANLNSYLKKIPKRAVWVAHNVFLPTERILKPLRRNLDIVYVSAPQTIKAYGDRYKEFLERRDDNLLLTTTGGEVCFEENYPGLLRKYWSKVIIGRCEMQSPKVNYAFDVVQTEGYFFSFVFATLMLLKAGAELVVFFGLDGGKVDGYKTFCCGEPDDYPSGWFNGPPGGGYSLELDYINRNWSHAVKAAGLDEQKFAVYNCSLASKVECFPKIDYDDLGKIFKPYYIHKKKRAKSHAK